MEEECVAEAGRLAEAALVGATGASEAMVAAARVLVASMAAAATAEVMAAAKTEPVTAALAAEATAVALKATEVEGVEMEAVVGRETPEAVRAMAGKEVDLLVTGVKAGALRVLGTVAETREMDAKVVDDLVEGERRWVE